LEEEVALFFLCCEGREGGEFDSDEGYDAGHEVDEESADESEEDGGDEGGIDEGRRGWELIVFDGGGV
jgi:hypothetical protein